MGAEQSPRLKYRSTDLHFFAIQFCSELVWIRFIAFSQVKEVMQYNFLLIFRERQTKEG